MNEEYFAVLERKVVKILTRLSLSLMGQEILPYHLECPTLEQRFKKLYNPDSKEGMTIVCFYMDIESYRVTILLIFTHLVVQSIDLTLQQPLEINTKIMFFLRGEMCRRQIYDRRLLIFLRTLVSLGVL